MTTTQRPHWKRGVFFFALTAIILIFFAFYYANYLQRVENIQHNIDTLEKEIAITKERIARDQAIIDSYSP